MALNSAQFFFLFQLQIPSTVMFSCLFEMLLYMVTDESALLWVLYVILPHTEKALSLG